MISTTCNIRNRIDAYLLNSAYPSYLYLTKNESGIKKVPTNMQAASTTFITQHPSKYQSPFSIEDTSPVVKAAGIISR
jgi:hypothetical protein